MKIDEIQHVSLPEPIKINGIIADMIDFRFEDWKSGQRDGGLAVFPNGEKFFTGNFSAPLKDGTWLNIGQSQGSFGNQDGGAARSLATQTASRVWISDKPTETPLPPYWEKFAIFYYDNNVSKMPEHPRDYEDVLHQRFRSANPNTIVGEPLPEKPEKIQVVK